MIKNRISLAVKLILPVFIGFLLIIGSVDYLIVKGSQALIDDYVKIKAFEYIESFLIATEVSSNQANIVRVTNSLGTYSDIKGLFVIDNKQLKIISSNKNRFNGKSVKALPELYKQIDLQHLMHTGTKYLKKLNTDEYLVGYRALILSEDRTAQRPITILMLTSPQSLSLFFGAFKNNVFKQSAFIYLLALLMFFILLQVILLRPIKRIITVLTNVKESTKPILCEIKSKDELGVLARTYNALILDRYERGNKMILLNKELEDLSQRDALTGLSNRRNFDRLLHEEWHRSIRNQEMISLIMIDVDYFKQFNDTYGHLAGDDCLKLIAKTLVTLIKRPGDTISRYGGEEFVAILPNSNDASWQLAEYCRREIENLVISKDEDNKHVRVTISLGLAKTIPQRDQHPDVLIKAADMALYEAKASGRNRVIVHDLNKDIVDLKFDKNNNVTPLKKH